jgi:predicted HicB family RNase H-like nuclease
MTKLTCKGYAATVEADPETGFLHGEVPTTGALLTIAGCSMDEVKAALEETIADYEELRRERNRRPTQSKVQAISG